MKKIYTAALAAAALSGILFTSAASASQTVTAGYASTNLGAGSLISKSIPGFNLKYHWESDDARLGAIGSFSYNTSTSNGIKLKRTGISGGPSVRFNDYVSLYGLVGWAGYSTSDGISSYSVGSFTYGAGVQVNPIHNLAIDASYEYGRIRYGIDGGVWVLGVGWRF